MASDLMKRIKKNSTIDSASILNESKYYDPNYRKTINTQIPMLNAAFSADPNVGMQAGILTIVGESKSYKSGFLLELVKAFQEQNTAAGVDGVVLFYDSEGGIPMGYFTRNNIDTSMIYHCPIKTIEILRHDLANQLKNITDADRVFIIIDSIGGLASQNEADIMQKSEENKADFTRAKALNSMFRVITPILTFNDIPLALINHGYNTMEIYSKLVVGGGKKSYLASNDIWNITRAVDKNGKEIDGYTFTINIEKSRKVKEKSKFPINVTYGSGLNKWSGIYEIASELGFLNAAGPWIKTINWESGEIENRKKAELMLDTEWFATLVNDPRFVKHIRDKYLLED